MEKRNAVTWFQLLAVCSALGLGGAYVWDRQKKAAPPTRPAEAPAVSSETIRQAPTSDVKPVGNPREEQRMILSGSKSGIINPPLPSDFHEFDENQKNQRTLMPSSKSGALLRQPSPPPPVVPNPRTVMPSSKSSQIMPLSDIQGTPKPRTVLPSSKSISPILENPQRNQQRNP